MQGENNDRKNEAQRIADQLDQKRKELDAMATLKESFEKSCRDLALKFNNQKEEVKKKKKKNEINSAANQNNW